MRASVSKIVLVGFGVCGRIAWADGTAGYTSSTTNPPSFFPAPTDRPLNGTDFACQEYLGNETLLFACVVQKIVSMNAKRVYVDVGTNSESQLEKHVEADKMAFLIGFEPSPLAYRTYLERSGHIPMALLPVAVAAGEPKKRKLYGTPFIGSSGLCDSLRVARPAARNAFRGVEGFGGSTIDECLNQTSSIDVHVVALESLLQQIPSHISIPFLAVDAQGQDFDIINSAGEFISRVDRVLIELQDLPEGDEHLFYEGALPKSMVVSKLAEKGLAIERCWANAWRAKEENCVFVQPHLRVDVRDDCFDQLVPGLLEMEGKEPEDDIFESRHRSFMTMHMLENICCASRYFELIRNKTLLDHLPRDVPCFDEEYTDEICCFDRYATRIGLLDQKDMDSFWRNFTGPMDLRSRYLYQFR